MDWKKTAREKLPMVGRSDEDGLTTAGAAVLAGIGTRVLVKAAWRAWRGEDPPQNPASPSTDWSEAIAWTAAISVAVGTARLLARRGASAARRKLAG